jgi:predicted secreted protein
LEFIDAKLPLPILSRVAGVAFVAHCLLNQNSKVDGGARTGGIYPPLVEELRAQGWRIEQMPCPELTFTGLHRFWAVKEQLDTAAFRRHCRTIARAVASAIELHAERGDDIVLVGLEGSPSMGVCVTSSDPQVGGRPTWPDGSTELAEGRGIYIEELEAELRERGFTMPRAMGVSHQLPDHDPAKERAELAELLGG